MSCLLIQKVRLYLRVIQQIDRISSKILMIFLPARKLQARELVKPLPKKRMHLDQLQQANWTQLLALHPSMSSLQLLDPLYKKTIRSNPSRKECLELSASWFTRKNTIPEPRPARSTGKTTEYWLANKILLTNAKK